MNNPLPPSDDAGLSALLRQARPAAGLPPRFQQNVWRRIESTETAARSENWLDWLANLVLRPRLAAGLAAGLLLAGAVAGTWQGRQTARQEAQMSYLAAVAPSVAP
jgi:anti-sigma factor RsiW